MQRQFASHRLKVVAWLGSMNEAAADWVYASGSRRYVLHIHIYLVGFIYYYSTCRQKYEDIYEEEHAGLGRNTQAIWQ